MKKRPFILMELLICIAILSLCAIPLMGYPYYSYRKQRGLLLEIEKQRQAEILFYELLKNIENRFTWNEIHQNYSEQKDPKILIVNSEGFGKISFNIHCHLYHAHKTQHEKREKKNIRKIWCAFCFADAKKKCHYKQEKNYPYKFMFYAKKRVT